MKTLRHVAVVGASGAIGRAFVAAFAAMPSTESIHAFSRQPVAFDNDRVHAHAMDVTDEASIIDGVAQCDQPLDIVIIAVGVLHDAQVQPEKALRDLSAAQCEHVFAINTIGPTLAVKHFAPRMAKDRPSVLAALSARVGSISDNRLGGWYAYRASKAALNMMLKTASIEMARTNKSLAIIGLHPGTVNSDLSAPFQQRVPEGKLFTPDYSVSQLLAVIDQVTPDDTGDCFAWDGEKVMP